MSERRTQPIKTVGLCVKPASRTAADAARALHGWLEERGVTVRADPDAAAVCGVSAHERETLAEKVDLLLVLGGDGTILAVVRESGSFEVPILGVNLGTLGFLAEINPDQQHALLEDMLAGHYEVEPRMRLRVRVVRDGTEILSALALNDAVFTRTELSRMLHIEARADGVPVTRYRGDGLIVSTPTGSTAYTLSAGGPILMPGSRVVALTPICPHTLTQRPLVLPAESALEITVRDDEGAAQLTVDGQVGASLAPSDIVYVTTDVPPAWFVVVPDRSRFEVLRTKLGWGAG